MNYVEEFRDGDKARVLVAEIGRTRRSDCTARRRAIHIMEVCGGHTHSIFRYGIEGMLPKFVELVHGPGCPVCVLPMGRVDDCVEHRGARRRYFRDIRRRDARAGFKKSLLQARADGADVRMVYSPMDALELARGNPAA